MIIEKSQAVKEFESMCIKLGIPTDRIELVKRNLQLKGLIQGSIKAMENFRDAWHETSHPGAPINAEFCTEGLCEMFTQQINAMKKGLK